MSAARKTRRVCGAAGRRKGAYLEVRVGRLMAAQKLRAMADRRAAAAVEREGATT